MFSSSIVKGNIGVIHFGGGGVTSIPAYQIPFTLNSVLILSKHYFIKNTYYHHRVFVDTEGYEGYQRILKDTNASSWIPNDTNAYPW